MVGVPNDQLSGGSRQVSAFCPLITVNSGHRSSLRLCPTYLPCSHAEILIPQFVSRLPWSVTAT